MVKMVENWVKVPSYLVREYKKSYKLFDKFFVDIIILTRRLGEKGYIENDTMRKWIEGINGVSHHLENYDIEKALEEKYDILKGISDALRSVEAKLFLEREDLPLDIKFTLEEITNSLCEFTRTLLDMAEYYEIINNISLLDQSTWSDKYNKICYYVRSNEYDEAIASIINIMKSIRPLINGIVNQLRGDGEPNDS
jgi:hypothetical protein